MFIYTFLLIILIQYQSVNNNKHDKIIKNNLCLNNLINKTIIF